MKLIYISPYFEPAYYYGGPVNSNFTLCKTLVSKGIEVEVLTTNANGSDRLELPLRQPISLNGIKVIYYPLLTNLYFFSPELVTAIKRRIQNFDIAFLQLMWTYALPMAASSAIKSCVPYVIPLRGQLLPWALNYKPLRKKIYLNLIGRNYLNRAASLYCTHLTEKESLVQSGIKAPAFVLSNMVDDSYFQEKPTKGYLRNRLGINQESKILLFLGRIHYKKRPEIAWMSLPEDKIDGKEIHLVYAGPDQINFSDWLKMEAIKSGMGQRVHFTGTLPRENVIRALADSDILLMPSEPNSENFGMSAAEALAVGVPIITSSGVPVGEMAQQAGAGLVIDNNPVLIKKAIVDLLSSPMRLEQMGINGRNLALYEFNPDILGEKMIAQLNGIISKEHRYRN